MTDRVETRFLRAQKAAKQRLKEEQTQKKEALELYPLPYISFAAGALEELEAERPELIHYAEQLIFEETK